MIARLVIRVLTSIAVLTAIALAPGRVSAGGRQQTDHLVLAVKKRRCAPSRFRCSTK